MKILLTGATGLLGRYISAEMSGDNVVMLPASALLDLSHPLDAERLSALDPDPSVAYDLVVHAAGTADPDQAMRVNFEGTKILLKALAHLPVRPKALTYISCDNVYSPDAGELIDEMSPLHPADEAGRSKVLAEKEGMMWSEASGIPLVILRPAMMFGSGVKGPAAKMFRQVTSGEFLHVRDEDGCLSIVTALDVARAVRLTAGKAGIYNVSDGKSVRWLDLAEAMSANAGARKRMITLPARWADLAWRWLRFIPAVKLSLDPEVRETRSATRTLSTRRLEELPGWNPFDTLEVISRTAEDYPYQDK